MSRLDPPDPEPLCTYCDSDIIAENIRNEIDYDHEPCADCIKWEKADMAYDEQRDRETRDDK